MNNADDGEPLNITTSSEYIPGLRLLTSNVLVSALIIIALASKIVPLPFTICTVEFPAMFSHVKANVL